MSDSYFDWEQKFKKKKDKDNDRDTKLGMTESEFKKFIDEWKEKQLKKKKNKERE